MAKLHVWLKFLWFEREARRYNNRVNFEERAIPRFSEDTTDAECDAFDREVKEEYDTPPVFSQESWDEFYKKICWPAIEKHIRQNMKNEKEREN